MPVAVQPSAALDVQTLPAQEGWATLPSVAVDGDGRPWIAWLERVAGGDSVWLAGDTRAASRLTRAAAIKDGPSLAWSPAAGLCCAWQSRDGNRWKLAVATDLDTHPGRAPELVALDATRRPSHPVLAAHTHCLFLASELHGATGSEVVLLSRDVAGWSAAVALSRLSGQEPDAAYDPAVAVAPDGVLWAAWIEARESRYDVWLARAPADRAGEPRAWSAPERISGGPHLSTAPRLLVSGGDVWVTWSNYSAGESAVSGRPWAHGPERRWERILYDTRRRTHIRRWRAATRSWDPEWREPDLPEEPALNPWQSPTAPNSHWPVLVPIGAGAGTDEVGLLCRRAVETFRWTVEAQRVRGHPDGAISWSDAATISTADGSDLDRSGGNMAVAWAAAPDGQVFCAWQRHDRARAAPGFHFTMGSSAIVVAPLGASAVPGGATAASVHVTERTRAPGLIRDRAAVRSVTIDGETYRLVFGNLHRHAECSSCGRDANGQAELHMRHAPDVNRSEFLAVTDHGEHLNDGEWREQCVLADFYTWDGTRVALPGIEWTSEAPWHPPAHGHKNIIFSRSDLPFVDCWMPHCDRPERLWAWLAEHDPLAVTIPHHTMRGKAPTLWEHADERFQPVVEIFQDTRGSAEWLGAPAATSTARVQGLPLDPRGSVRRALDRGLRLGLIASSDHGGVALAGVYVKEVSRAGILEGLRARRCFATSGDRLLLDFRVNGVFQGDVLDLTELPRGRDNQATPLAVTLRAEVLRPVLRLVLVRDGAETEVVTPNPAARLIEQTWQVEGPFVGTSYYYVRLESADGELAWSSPVWVTRDWSGA